MTATLDKHHRLTLPKELREKAGFKPGASLELTFSGQGSVTVSIVEDHDTKTAARKKYLETLERLCSSGGTDPTMVAPPDVPWYEDTPRMPIL